MAVQVPAAEHFCSPCSDAVHRGAKAGVLQWAPRPEDTRRIACLPAKRAEALGEVMHCCKLEHIAHRCAWGQTLAHSTRRRRLLYPNSRLHNMFKRVSYLKGWQITRQTF